MKYYMKFDLHWDLKDNLLNASKTFQLNFVPIRVPLKFSIILSLYQYNSFI